MNARSSQFVLFAGLVLASPAFGQVCREYDASIGTLPFEQGWDGGPSDSRALVSVSGGVLMMDTTPFTAPPICGITPEQNQTLNWRVANGEFEFEDGLVFESELMIIDAQDQVNPCTGWPRAGFMIIMTDESGFTFGLSITNTRVYLFRDGFDDTVPPNIVQASIDTRAEFLRYRLEINGPSARLFIDDKFIIEHTQYGPAIASDESLFRFGDMTTWANSSAEVRSFAFRTGGCCSDADLAEPYGVLNFNDVIAFLNAFGAADPVADLAEPFGTFNFNDVVEFLTLFAAGCP